MKLNPDFVIQQMEAGVSVLVPTGAATANYKGIIRLNETAAFIVNELKNDTTVDAVVEALDKEYEGTKEQFSESVKLTIDSLREAGAIIE